MPQVVVTIDEKTYRMACGEGEQAHLEALAAEVDGKIATLREGFGQIGDLRLTVMAAIMATDELSEARRRIAELESGLHAGKTRSSELQDGHAAERASFADAMNETAEMLERLGARLDAS